jgi:ribosomal protein S2
MTIEHIKIISLLKNQFALGSLKKKTNKLLWGKLLGIRNNYLIIDLNYTILNLYKTINIIKYLFLYKRKVFVIDWDLSILSDMIDILDTTEQYYLCGKWIFGFLTNIRNFRMLYEKFFYFLKELKSNILEKKQKLTKKKK